MQNLYIKTQFANINPPFNIKNTYQTQKYLYTNAYAGNTNIHLAPLMTLLHTMNNLSHLPLRAKYNQLVHILFINCLHLGSLKPIDILR